ncbi:pur operon repressor [Effusibacillus lacus]|uniref:Pur operon repressor n=1 Tax=Effusibacillus lacus TaxID=1348429 RepID=A0A292YIG7_9BACL|nr:purine operon repressor PurR [Effusibacillus lacus]GAX88671.1 pur operon repressor [Effusibacillus lacus]
MRRSERIVRLTQTLLEQPYRLLSLTEMADQLSSAKSSLSEDLSIIRDVLSKEGTGILETHAGAAGGVRYIPRIPAWQVQDFVQEMCRILADPERILPGGYLYISDILGQPDVLDRAGRIFAHIFSEMEADYVLTVETKGIPLAVSTARYLHLPTVVVRRDHRVTEGSAVSINYVSGSRRIQTMSLSRRSLPEHSRVLIIDDFMKAGGTAKALIDMMKEFKTAVAGIGVFMSTSEPEDKMLEDYVSLTTLAHVDEISREIQVSKGNFKLSDKER